MAYTFYQGATAKITAPIGGSSTAETISIDGTNASETSADNAAAQINKITGIFGVTVTAAGMKQVIEKEATLDE